MRTILFPTDFSPASAAALTCAASLARDSGARLLVLHVQNAQEAYAGGTMVLPPTEVDPELERKLRAVAPADKSVICEHRLAIGTPADVIVQVAGDEKAEMIVMGTHGHTGLRRLLMGSVAEAVVRRAPCPVLTMRQPDASS